MQGVRGALLLHGPVGPCAIDACILSGAASVPGRSRSASRYLRGRCAMARSGYFLYLAKMGMGGFACARRRRHARRGFKFRLPRTNTRSNMHSDRPSAIVVRQ